MSRRRHVSLSCLATVLSCFAKKVGKEGARAGPGPSSCMVRWDSFSGSSVSLPVPNSRVILSEAKNLIEQRNNPHDIRHGDDFLYLCGWDYLEFGGYVGQSVVPGRKGLARDCLNKTKAFGDLQEEEIGGHTDGSEALNRRPPMAMTNWPWAGFCRWGSVCDAFKAPPTGELAPVFTLVTERGYRFPECSRISVSS